jgi:hypothetical protein
MSLKGTMSSKAVGGYASTFSLKLEIDASYYTGSNEVVNQDFWNLNSNWISLC